MAQQVELRDPQQYTSFDWVFFPPAFIGLKLQLILSQFKNSCFLCEYIAKCNLFL